MGLISSFEQKFAWDNGPVHKTKLQDQLHKRKRNTEIKRSEHKNKEKRKRTAKLWPKRKRVTEN